MGSVVVKTVAGVGIWVQNPMSGSNVSCEAIEAVMLRGGDPSVYCYDMFV